MERWTIEKIKDGFERFYKEHKRFPTAHEIDSYAYLPSSRQIQRKYGGLPELRKVLKLSGPLDFTKGQYSSERARKISLRGHVYKEAVSLYLVNHLGEESVHRDYFFIDDRRTRTDFFIDYNKKSFIVDIFYPTNYKNLIGCINSKLKAYKSKIMLEYPTIFLMMNEDISKEEIERVLSQKKNILHKNQEVMTYGQFKEFCASIKKS